jgi:hypothetical protein
MQTIYFRPEDRLLDGREGKPLPMTPVEIAPSLGVRFFAFR